MTKPPATPELPEPELGYIETDKSRQPAFSARQMREALRPQAVPMTEDNAEALIEDLVSWASYVDVDHAFQTLDMHVRQTLESHGITAPAAEAPEAMGQHWTEREPVRLKQSRAGRVYVAGPMTGLPDFNFPAFNAEAAVLRAQGLTVINPAEHGIVEGAVWADYLRHDIAGLVSCERIHLLQGWEKSKGARLEFQIATELGMEVTHQVEQA